MYMGYNFVALEYNCGMFSLDRMLVFDRKWLYIHVSYLPKFETSGKTAMSENSTHQLYMFTHSHNLRSYQH